MDDRGDSGRQGLTVGDRGVQWVTGAYSGTQWLIADNRVYTFCLQGIKGKTVGVTEILIRAGDFRASGELL